MELDPYLSDLRELQYTMIMIELEPRLIIVQSIVPPFTLESKTPHLSAILLQSRETLDVGPECIVNHLENL